MADFNRSNRGGGGRSFGGGGRGGFGGGNRGFGGGGRSFGGGGRGGFGGDRGERNDRPREMTEVICSECGNTCEVPFKPSSDKPVYCNDCFASKRNSENKREDRGERNERRGEARPERSEIRFHDKAAESKNTKKIESLENSIKNLNDKIETLTLLFSSLQDKKVEAPKTEAPKAEVKKIETKTAPKKTVQKVAAKKVAKKTVSKKK
jgi:CxxC-x17-CxxC domain-containing protein